MATEELIKKGCKNILFIRIRIKLSTTNLRFLGYIEALDNHHLPFKEELAIDLEQVTFEETKATMKRLIEQGLIFDGTFTTNDWLALGALVCLKELNFKVPEDYKIVGFANISISKYSYLS
ncbi:substrate-binding domain-containing protein [Virgibacillus pantothenticus]|uniref:substrate-binding domain-containing protein n=1 Tax=Virgibacillus pantothenticus TaxID=1473 RepID=UPI000985BF5D|nr:substrate-binding domain-containing protein [Virgibacillus pantothenticus]